MNLIGILGAMYLIIFFSLWEKIPGVMFNHGPVTISLNYLPMSLHWDDVECPYCWAMQDIDHDDWYGYAEDETFEQQCSECEKYFAFTTSILYCYDAVRADCLNGAEHDITLRRSWPKEYSRMWCRDCGYSRQCTPEEIANIS